MKVIVTGGAGYVGSFAVRLLADAGHDVVVFDSLERGHTAAVDPRAELIVGDLRSRPDIAKAVGSVKPDAVMHFAAYAYVGESMGDPVRYFGNNVGGSINLIEAMAEFDVRRIIFSSTCATYGEPEKMPITEATDQRPTNPYGETKLIMEKLLSWMQRTKGFEPTFLRYFNACGAWDHLGEDHDPEPHIIPLLMQCALGQREEFRIFGDDYETPDGTCIRDYIHVRDLAQAHLAALESKAIGAFNLGTGSGYSVKQVIDAARSVTGKPIPVSVSDRRVGDPPHLVADATKARQNLGWSARFPAIETILSDAWTWHQSHPHGYPKDSD
jgi:UDP-glucose-4-epimerase GalE